MSFTLLKIISKFQGAAQEYVIEDGAGAIVKSLWGDIKSDVNILLDQAVTTVEQSEVRFCQKFPSSISKLKSQIYIIRSMLGRPKLRSGEAQVNGGTSRKTRFTIPSNLSLIIC